MPCISIENSNPNISWRVDVGQASYEFHLENLFEAGALNNGFLAIFDLINDARPVDHVNIFFCAVVKEYLMILMKGLGLLSAIAVTSPFAENLKTQTVQSQIVTRDGQLLSAVFTLPAGPILGAVLILQGSGNVSKDGDVSSPFLGQGYRGQSAKLSEQVSEALAASGIASLRYSKRGVDDSSELPNQKFPYLVDDAESAFRELQAQFPGIKASLVGFSEGALVASLLANSVDVDGLFLLAPVVRPIDDVFKYQFLTWPIELLKNKLEVEKPGVFTAAAFSKAGISTLPLLGASWDSIDLDQNHEVSVSEEMVPAYEKYFDLIQGVLATPAYSGWYQSLKSLPDFSIVAHGVQSKVVHVYQGGEDAQVNPSWIEEDMGYFPAKPHFHYYPNLGHCFSPMDGVIGEIKTSGPHSAEILEQLAKDVQSLK